MIYRVDNLTENNINPITNIPYDDNWAIFMLTDSKDYNMFVGSINGCAYAVKFSRYANEDWHFALCDFIGYNEANNKNIILVLQNNELIEAQKLYTGHSFNDAFLRENEPKYLVHSTTTENYNQIQKDGMLKCFNKLNSGYEPIGVKLGDPKEFSDYIMFYNGGTTGEIVVNSKQKGSIVIDINDEYIPGARLYFDAEKIAKDVLLIRDGCHLKVKSELPLIPYLLFTATAESIGLSEQISTPKKFSEIADKRFKEYIK